ncbi:hypothetical protein [Neosynechococcus sphagnicola]|uniref:GspE/PulE/PilB domain-containing protein n=1 Tax=Neosynechococcus sphagnicola TaxID=1501145 RepID=UPI00068FB331|nr:hypothetical protein [Neosynechococcus sphagnicola]
MIDRILPFEGCLYHQVVPLSVEGSRINLGMVNPNDAEALAYVRQILAYLRCSLVPRQISLQTHSTLLSAYLTHSGKQHPDAHPPSALSKKPASAVPPVPTAPPPPTPPKAPPTDRFRRDASSQSTLILENSAQEDNAIGTPPVPEEEPSSSPLYDTVHIAFPKPPQAKTPPAQVPPPVAPSATKPPATKLSPAAKAPPPPLPAKAEPQGESSPPLTLEINAVHISSPMRLLAMLPPYNLMQELLARAASGGIGRIFFELQQFHGRILWSQDGVLQSVMEPVDPTIYQGAITELKRLHNLPLQPVQKPVVVEIERFYQQTRLVLRLQVKPGAYGEEANLQVLRGVALQFHQQQQLTNLSREALSLTEQLQRKLNQIHKHILTDQIPEPAQANMMSTLTQLLTTINQQIQELDVLSKL